MKKLELLILISVLFSCNSKKIEQLNKFGNVYSNQVLIEEADSLKDIQQLRNSIVQYLKAYKIDSNNIELNYKISCVYSLNNDIDSAFFYLEKATNSDSSINFLTNPDYIYLLNDNRWEKIKDNQFLKYKQKKGAFKNMALSKKLLEIKLKDQAYYYFIRLNNKKESKKYWAIKDSINKVNLKQVSEIIDKNGWPKISDVGKEAANAVFLVIQHADLITQKKYLPLMEKAVQNNEAKKSSLPLLIDRINIKENKKQIYGSQIDYDYKTNSYFFNYNTLVDPKNVNKRRIEMDLQPIEEYLMNWNIEWNPPD